MEDDALRREIELLTSEVSEWDGCGISPAAERCAGEILGIIAREVAAERERCARIADERALLWTGEYGCEGCGEEIAADIRGAALGGSGSEQP